MDVDIIMLSTATVEIFLVRIGVTALTSFFLFTLFYQKTKFNQMSKLWSNCTATNNTGPKNEQWLLSARIKMKDQILEVGIWEIRTEFTF